MFLIRSHNPQPTGPALTALPAIDDRDARRARHLRHCERLGEMAMELAEAARVEALEEFQPPAPRRGYAIPGLPDPPPFSRTTTFNDLFQQLSRCARQAMLLEARLDAGLPDHPPAGTGHHPATARDPAPATPGVSGQTRIDHERLEDLDAVANRPAPEIIAGISAELASIVDSRQLPAPARPAPAAQPHRRPAQPAPLSAAERSAIMYERGAQRATSPPRT